MTEPTFPATCAILRARLHSTPDFGPVIGQTAAEQDAESTTETTALTHALSQCASGQAVELTLGRESYDDAFLINPVTLPQGVSLIIDGGVTVYASRDPQEFQDSSAATCGTVGAYAVNEGCQPLLTLAASSGVYGYGVLDGQGDKTLIGGDNAGTDTWWSLLSDKKACKHSGSLASAGCEQAAPLMISAGDVKGGSSPNSDLTLYKITIRNPPFHTVNLGGTGTTVWGVKVQAPWTVPNTDGFDVQGTDITIYDTIVSNGDQEIAITGYGPAGASSGSAPTTNVTVDRFKGYGRAGIALLGGGVGISDVLVQNADITGDLPSVVGTVADGGPAVVNGVPARDLTGNKYHLASSGQALPNATNDLYALSINTNTSADAESKPGPVIGAITFKSICIQDIVKPIHVGWVVPFTPPQSPTNLPKVSGVTFQDIHVLAPTPQFPALDHGIPTTPAALGSYAITFEAYPQASNAASFINYFTLDNVVFDDYAAPSGGTSIGAITAIGNVITAQTNVYPPVLNELQAHYVEHPKSQDGLTLSANWYEAKAPMSSPTLAHPCPPGPWPFVTGELYASVTGSSNLNAASVAAGSSVTLNAVVQPIMSQTTQFMPDIYSAEPGLLAVGSPALTNPVVFFDGARPIGFGDLAANGTLATFTVRNVQPGTHTYTAAYPADRFYKTLWFGSVTVQAQ